MYTFTRKNVCVYNTYILICIWLGVHYTNIARFLNCIRKILYSTFKNHMLNREHEYVANVYVKQY